MTRVAATLGRTLGAPWLLWQGEHQSAAFAAIVVYMLRVAGAAAAYFTQVYLARLLGVEQYGVFAVIWVWIAVIGHLLPLGFSQTVCRFMPHYLATGERGALKAYLCTGFGFVLLMAVAFCGLGLAALWLLRDAVGAALIVPLLVTLAVLPFFGLQEFLENIARALNLPVRAILPPYLIRHALIGLLMFVLVGAGFGRDLTTTMLATLAATASAAALQLVLLAPRLLPMLAGRGDRSDNKSWFRTALPLVFVDGTHIILANIDVIVLGFVASKAEIAVYFAATRLQHLVGFVTYAVTAATAQRYSALHAVKRKVELRALAAHSTRAGFFLSVLAALGVFAVSPLLLSLFGEDFSAGIPVLAILLIGLVAAAAMGPGEDILNMLGHERACARTFFWSVIGSALFCIALAIPFGIYGAATAVAVTSVLRGWVLAMQTQRHLGLRIRLWQV